MNYADLCFPEGRPGGEAFASVQAKDHEALTLTPPSPRNSISRNAKRTETHETGQPLHRQINPRRAAKNKSEPGRGGEE